MWDLVLWIAMLGVAGGLGLPCARALPARLAWRMALAPMFGIAILAVVVPIGYRFGASMKLLLAIAAIGAAVSIAWHLRRHAVPRDRIGRMLLGAWLVASLLLLAPRWTGGDQFAVFQGNQWDTYNYLESAIAYATKPYHAVHSAGSLQLLRNPLFTVAQGQLDQRPSVHELYALFSRVAPGQAYRLYYTFLIWFMAQLVLVMLFVARNVLPRAPPWTWLAIAVAFPLGFWGQYVVDIDAWSQIASAPLLFAMFGFVLLAPNAWSRRDAWRIAGGLALACAGAVYLYPEGFFISCAALIPVGTVAIAWPMLRARRFELARVIPLTGFAGVVASALYPPVLHFLIQQVMWSAGNRMPWWQFFQRFFVGRDDVWGDGFARVADFVAGVFGCYFVTPSSEDGPVAMAIRIAILVGLAGLILAFVRFARDDRPERPQILMWGATALVLLAPAAYIATTGNYWAAGKVLSYAAPVLVTALCISIARPGRWRWFAAVFIAVQVVAGLVRIPAATWDSHAGFAAPYPSVQNRGLKHDIGWDLRVLEPLLDSHSKVSLYPEEPWTENALMVFMAARGIPFVKQSPVTSGPGGNELGKMPMPWTPTVELSLTGDTATLHYFDGRPEVRVKTR
ncbi:MAG TPA: hypothetical protein VIV58_08075 [Kofleriaceae bacterium]